MDPDPDYIATIADAWARSDASGSSYDRGQILEALVQFVLAACPASRTGEAGT
jgi:hypothetical protein